MPSLPMCFFFFFQAEDGIRDVAVTGVQTCALPILFWDVQDTMIEDIERIEVISGPGGTLWGSNAVNGVINIITRHSQDTTGALVSLGEGTEERGAGVRYGAKQIGRAHV